MLLEIGLNSVDRDETEIKEDIKKKGKKEELEDLENKVENYYATGLGKTTSFILFCFIYHYCSI